jgi:hypothetical protein
MLQSLNFDSWIIFSAARKKKMNICTGCNTFCVPRDVKISGISEEKCLPSEWMLQISAHSLRPGTPGHIPSKCCKPLGQPVLEWT